jgi:YD repeat-containing protein
LERFTLFFHQISNGYDGADRLTDKVGPGTSRRSVHWDYDGAGNLVRLQSQAQGGGPAEKYTYDQLNRLKSVSGGTGNQGATYSYDAVGNLSGMQTFGQSGVLSNTSYSYDQLNRLTQMQTTCGQGVPGCASPATPIASYAYTLGPSGNRLSVSELSGRTVQYTYDDLYRLTSETIAGAAAAQNGTVSYQYDAAGNRKQLNSTLPAVPTGLLNYDANDRIATQVYDNNGNTINNGLQNVYDFENHLVQRGNVQIVYDGDGNRVQETVAGQSVFYLVADVNPTGYPQVLEEQDREGVPERKHYIWGLQGVGGLQRVTVGSGFAIQDILVPFYFGLDGHGSVRYLTDPNGVVTDTYDYDAFGNLIAQTGTTQNNYLFAGDILKRHDIPPAEKRKKNIRWKDFIRAHMAVMVGTDFFTVEVLTLTGSKTFYVLFFLHLESRRICLAGITRHPDQEWMEQMARNVTMDETGFLIEQRYLLHDRDSKYCSSFRKLIEAEKVKALALPPQSPNLNA